jgi:hypothetical protein
MSPQIILIGMLFGGALVSLANYSILACDLKRVPVRAERESVRLSRRDS